MPRLPKAVLALGFVSFLTDFSSEMIYPLLPAFVSTLPGGGPGALGLIEGLAEFIASMLKVFSGVWADKFGKRKPMVLGGYALAGIARPLIGLANAWPVVLFLRVLDRVGKGLRTSPRDAMLADVAPPEIRARAFGFHRGMDHAGAAVGGLAGSLLLALGFGMRSVFLLAAIPAAAVMFVLVFSVRETGTKRSSSELRPKFSFKGLPLRFRQYLFALLLFNLGNSSDVFLLLRLTKGGVALMWIPLLWSAQHLFRSVANIYCGRLADLIGRKPLIGMGWILYACVYILFALKISVVLLVGIFLIYGIFYGLTEPAERALVGDLTSPDILGTAFGAYNGVVGFAALPASMLFGLLWQKFGFAVPFGIGAALALAAATTLTFVPVRFQRD